ncbi:pyridoxamine 5'-phosphate oxidase [bacterium CG06_land_8_20_14_3_00_33_50]|nr:MAG: pyridoxamine 5'-phosphate oxidase [bacterium CG06_land_8_20_14_3_00_33_50]PJA72512.1 MAG: pyridoxamine 5'-phosphate oxidase [bacterium CG_4_9_14_3_um_filter_33_26]
MNNHQEQKQLILGFIRRHYLAYLATSSLDGKPENAVVEFTETDNLELIFDAFPNFRKCKNIKENPRVAVVIGGEENITIQYEGEAQELEGEELEKVRTMHLSKHPQSAEIIKSKGLKFYKVIPKWIRYLDVNSHPWKTFEVIF